MSTIISGFNEWNSQKSQELTASSGGDLHLMASTSSADQGGIRYRSSSGHLERSTASATTGANDTHSSSSDNSSMSMLEETQSPEGDGYKTPNSLDHCNITGQMSDQFALAVLRLQHGLEETNSRLNKIEAQVAQSIESIRSLENQTHAKQPVGGDGCGRCRRCPPDRARSGCSGNRLISLLSRIDSLQWFYLSYPIVVYALFRAIERRRRQLDR